MSAAARKIEVTDEGARDKLEQWAYQQGRRDADVDNRLRSHDHHLRRTDAALERLGEVTEKLDEKLDELILAQGADDAVAADRERQAQTGLTKIQTWALCIGVPVGFIAAVLSPFIAHWLSS